MASSLGPDASPVPLGAGEAALKNLETETKASNETFQMQTTITNLTTKLLYNGQQMLWPGTTGTTPGRIASGTFTTATHTGTLPAGVKFGRVYTDSDQELPTTRKFVFAFDSPTGKVYAESGPIGPVDWNVVEDRLGKSERTVVYEDNILGGKIEAGVYENGNGYVRFRDA